MLSVVVFHYLNVLYLFIRLYMWLVRCIFFNSVFTIFVIKSLLYSIYIVMSLLSIYVSIYILLSRYMQCSQLASHLTYSVIVS